MLVLRNDLKIYFNVIIYILFGCKTSLFYYLQVLAAFTKIIMIVFNNDSTSIILPDEI